MNDINYRELIDNAPFGYCYLKVERNNNDVDFNYIYGNKEFEICLGMESIELEEKDIVDIFTNTIESGITWNEIINILNTKGSCKVEGYNTKSRSWIKFEFNLNNKGDLFVTSVDISIEKLEMDICRINDIELQRSRSKYKLLIEKAHEGILVIYNDKFVFSNPMAEKITGYTKDELLNLPFDELVQCEDLEASITDYKKSEFENYVQPYQFRMLDKHRNVKWLELSATHFEWEGKDAVLCLMNDVSKRKEAEDALRESKKRKDLLIKSMRNFIFILDSDFSFVEFYAPSIEMLLLKPEDFLGKKFSQLKFPEKAMNVILEGLKKTSKTGDMTRIEYSLFNKGKLSWYEAIITLMNHNLKEKKEYLCVVREITTLKESQLEIQAERDLFSAGPVMTIVWNYSDEWSVKRVSKNIKNILGYNQEEFLHPEFKYTSVVYKEDRERTIKEVANYIEDKVDLFEQSYRIKDKMGRYHWFYDFTRVIRDSDGNVLEIRGYLFDQSHIKEVEEQLEREKERLKNIIEGTNAGTWEWNIDKDEFLVDKRWAELLGYEWKELKVLSKAGMEKYIHGDDLKGNTRLLNEHFIGKLEYYSNELRMRHKNGEWVWVSCHGKVLKHKLNGKPLVMFGTIIDITEKKKIEERVLEASIRDPLTNLYNRRYIFDRLNEIKAKFDRMREPFSIAIIDLDHFKNINDNYGHIAGDFILQQFCGILNYSFRKFDLIGRYGGEEFIIIMTNCQKDIAAKRIERILEEVRQKIFLYKDQKIKITFSCGISDTEDFEVIILDKLIDTADKRMYKAKKSGRNQVVFENFYEDGIM